MDLRTGLLSVLLISGLTVACASRADAPTAPTDAGQTTAVGSSAVPLPPPPLPLPSGKCDAAKAQSAIGEPASQALLERMRAAAGADTARYIRPDERITLEFSPARLNLNLNAKDVVQSVYCG